MNLLNKAAKLMGKKGGLKSAESRLGNMTAEESVEMRRIRLYNQRYTPEEQKEMDEMGDEFVANLNKNVSEEKSELMRKVRLTPRQKKEVDLMMGELIESLRKAE